MANYAPKASGRPNDECTESEFVLQRQDLTRFVRDALLSAVDKQKENTDKRGRKNTSSFTTGEQVPLSTDGISNSAVTNLGAKKLAPRFIGPFKIKKVLGDAYMLDIPTTLRLHPTFYVRRLKEYHPATIPETAQTDEPAPLHTLTAPLAARDVPTPRSSQARVAVDSTLQDPYTLQQLPIRLPKGSRSLRSIRRLLHGNVDLSHPVPIVVLHRVVALANQNARTTDMTPPPPPPPPPDCRRRWEYPLDC